MSTTLERIEDSEKTVASLLAQVALLNQELSSLKTSVEQQNNNTMQYFQFILQSLQKTEQTRDTLDSLSKMFNALVNELVDTKTVNGPSVMTRVRIREEEKERARVADLVKGGTLVEYETTGPVSVIAFSHNLTRGADVTVVAEFGLMELSSKEMPDNIRALFVGKKVGDVVEVEEPSSSETKSLFKILAIYGIATGQRQGEVSRAEAPAVAEAPAETAPDTSI